MFSAGAIGDVRDQRIEPGTPLGREDGRHCARVRRVGPQTIDGLGRQDDKLAPAQGFGGVLYAGGRQWARWAIRATFTVTLVSTTSPVFH